MLKALKGAKPGVIRKNDWLEHSKKYEELKTNL